jgi:ribokinase
MSAVVFGSINMDMITRAPHLPRPGETLIGHGFNTTPGGKGANQAVACARLGVPTRMVGRVGDDGFGQELRTGLAANGVDVSSVAVTAGSSGVAAITVDDSGENNIIVVPGANSTLGTEDLARLADALVNAQVLLLQLEVPLAAVLSAAQLARARGVMVILDPAPAQDLPPELYRLADIITPNESEAAELVGFALDDDAAIRCAAQLLRERSGGAVLIKLGARGVFLLDTVREQFVPGFAVSAVDTVAAGDAFNGGLAAGLCAGLPLWEEVRRQHSEFRSVGPHERDAQLYALTWALAAGALAVTRPGAQQAMPTRAELLALLNGRS